MSFHSLIKSEFILNQICNWRGLNMISNLNYFFNKRSIYIYFSVQIFESYHSNHKKYIDSLTLRSIVISLLISILIMINLN